MKGFISAIEKDRWTFWGAIASISFSFICIFDPAFDRYSNYLQICGCALLSYFLYEHVFKRVLKSIKLVICLAVASVLIALILLIKFYSIGWAKWLIETIFGTALGIFIALSDYLEKKKA